MYSQKEHDYFTSEYNRKAELLKSSKFKNQEELEASWHNKKPGKYLSDAVFAANDGIITTYAVVAGVAGADLSVAIILILGFANMLSDAFSMGLGNFLGRRSQAAYVTTQRKKEEWEVDHIPEVEIAEIRKIFNDKGFTGQDLERAVEIVVSNKKIWIDTMMKDELGIVDDQEDSPYKHGLATLVAFIIAGIIPLLPFLIPSLKAKGFLYSLIIAMVALFIFGALRSIISGRNFWLAGLEMLLVGGIAAGVAYSVGYFIAQLI